MHREGPELSSFTSLEGRFGWCGLYACSSGMCLRWELYEIQECNVDIEPYCLKSYVAVSCIVHCVVTTIICMPLPLLLFAIAL